jgi:hypothetical protein
MRLRKMFTDQGAITGGQIHAHDFDRLLAFQARQVAFQRSFTAAQHHILHLVILEVAEGSGIAMPAREEMLVNAENPRTRAADAFAGQQFQVPRKPTLDGGAGQALALRQTAPADPIEMFLAHAAPERLSGTHTRQDPGEALPEAALTGSALPLARIQFQHTAAQPPVFMPQRAGTPVLLPQLLSATVRTQNLPAEPCAYPHHTSQFLDRGNLVIGQAY